MIYLNKSDKTVYYRIWNAGYYKSLSKVHTYHNTQQKLDLNILSSVTLVKFPPTEVIH